MSSLSSYMIFPLNLWGKKSHLENFFALTLLKLYRVILIIGVNKILRTVENILKIKRKRIETLKENACL